MDLFYSPLATRRKRVRAEVRWGWDICSKVRLKRHIADKIAAKQRSCK